MSEGNGLPDGWECCRIDELGSVQLGRQRSPGKRSDKFPTKYLRAANVTWNGLALDDVLEMEFTPSERETFKLRRGDILLSEASGSASEVGKPALWNEELDLCCFQNTLIRFRSFALNPRYAVHLFSHLARSGVFVEVSRGVGIHHIGAKRFSSLNVPVPPLQEQERVADRVDECLSDLAAGVAALERTQRKLKRYRSAVLHAAVTGKLTAEWRQSHGSPAEPGDQLLVRILRERREQWEARTLAKYEADGRTPPKNWRERYPMPVEPKTEKLPELPDGWCWASLDQLFQLVRNGTAIVPRASTGIPILRISAVRPMRLDITDVRYLTPTEATAADSWLEVGDLLFTRYNGSARLCGVCGRVERLHVPTVHPDKLIKCKVTEGTVDPAFIELAANAGQTRSAIEARLRTTAGQVGVSGIDIKASPIPFPPLAEQGAIIELVQEKLSQIDAMEAEVDRGLARAGRLRQAILKSAFVGKLVPQDPHDEPAAVLLDRIRGERESQAQAAAPKRARRKKAAKKSPSRKKAKRA